MQAIKFDRVVVARRMQDHAVRCRARLFVADIGVARETDVSVIDVGYAELSRFKYSARMAMTEW
jgi:hypothetical protein